MINDTYGKGQTRIRQFSNYLIGKLAHYHIGILAYWQIISLAN